MAIHEFELHETKSLVEETKHGLIHFPNSTRQVKSAQNEESDKPQAVFIDEALKIAPMTTEMITASIDQPSEGNTTGTSTPLENYTETARLLS